MKRKLFFGLVVIVSIGIILFEEIPYLKFLICDTPNSVIVTVEPMDDRFMNVTFMTTSSAETLRTYEYHIDGDTLYVGAKYWINPFGGGSDPVRVTIPIHEDVTKVVYRGGTEEVEIYPGS
jgi:hypothetical protein